MSTETIGLFGRPAAGILEDAPDVVLVKRGKGYPYPPWAEVPEDFFHGASGVGKPVGTDWSNIAKYGALKFAASQRKELAEISRADAAYAALKEWYKPVDFAAMNFGSAVHLVTARLDAGRHVEDVECDDEKRLVGCCAAWEQWKADHAVRFGAIERTLYAAELKVAGTADRIAVCGNPPDGPGGQPLFGPKDMVVIDLKTTGQQLGKVEPSIEYVAQLTALAQATHIVHEETKDFTELPAPIRYGALVYLTPEGYRTQWIDVHQPTVIGMVRDIVGVLRANRSLGRGAFGLSTVKRIGAQAEGPALVAMPA